MTNEFNLINKMTDNLAKAAIKKTVMKLYSIEFEDFPKEECYTELLTLFKICNEIETNKWLTFRALECTFFENSKFKAKLANEEAVKYFDYLIDRKAYKKDKVFQNNFFKFINHQKYSVIFEKSGINTKDKEILEFICELSKDIKIIFECIDFMSAKVPAYIRSQCNYEFRGKFEDYLEQLKSFFLNSERDHTKEYFSIEYDDKEKFHFKYYSYEEEVSLNKKMPKSPTFQDIKSYILKNSVAVKKHEKNDNKIKSTFEIKESEPLNKKDENPQKLITIGNIIEHNEIIEKKNDEELTLDSNGKKLLAFIRQEYDEKFKLQDRKIIEQNIKLNSLQKENEELRIKINFLQEENGKIKLSNINLNKKISSLKKTHESDMNHIKKEISKEKENYLTQIKNEREKYLNLNEKYNNAKIFDNKLVKEKENQSKVIFDLNKDKELLNFKLNRIQCRTLSKSIIDFFYYVYTSNIQGDNYFNEKDSIIKEIEKLDKTNLNSVQKLILNQLVLYLNTIYTLKTEGDEFAHPSIEFDFFITIVGAGYEHLINLIKKLDLFLLFNKYNELYKLQKKEGNTDKILKEIKIILIEKKDNFLQLFREQK